MSYNFNFADSNTRRELQNMCDVITELNLWDYMRNFDESRSFMTSNDNEIRMISDHPKNDHHSGASFGMALRSIKFIVDYGIDSFRNQYQMRNIKAQH